MESTNSNSASDSNFATSTLSNVKSTAEPCEGVMIPARILAFLPSGITYHACNVEMESLSNENEVQFCTTLWLNLSTKEEFEEWLQSFQEISHVTWRVKRTFPTDGVRLLFKKAYRCQHNTRPENATTNSKRRVPSKNTNCEADMMVKIRVSKVTVRKRRRSKDHQQYQTQIFLNNKHNHPVECADALKFRDVSESTQAALIDLFKRKYGPTKAVKKLKKDLQMKYGEDFHTKAADRAICPDIHFAHRLYRKVFPTGLPSELLDQPSSPENVEDSVMDEEVIMGDTETVEAEPSASHGAQNPALASLRAHENGFSLRDSSAQQSSSSKDDLLNKFHSMCSKMAQKIDQYPDVFRPAVNAMVQSYNNIKTDGHLITAMHSFGKSTPALRKGGKRRTDQIGVQPTATARRRRHIERKGKRNPGSSISAVLTLPRR